MITQRQIRMAMACLDLNLTDAAARLKIGRATLQRVARDPDGFAKAEKLTLERIKTGFELLGVEFGEDGSVKPKG